MQRLVGDGGGAVCGADGEPRQRPAEHDEDREEERREADAEALEEGDGHAEASGGSAKRYPTPQTVRT